MLEHLYIKNIALIDEITIDFHVGLNILTGETGAGKSILIDSINFGLGERATKDFIRKGEESAHVEILFHINTELMPSLLEEFGIEVEEDGCLLIARSIHQSGKNLCKVNGKVVTLGMLKQVSEYLIDVHGQHAHQSLLDASRHIELLDEFCGDELIAIKAQLVEVYNSYKEVLDIMHRLTGNEREREQRIDILKYQIEEIGKARLKIGEEEELLAQRKVLQNSHKLMRGVEESYALLHSGEDSVGAVTESIGRISSILEELSEIDSNLESLYQNMESVSAQVDDIVREIRLYREGIEHDPQVLYDLETRLDMIHTLKRKYGSSIKEILEHYDRIQEQLHEIENADKKLHDLEKKKAEQEKQMTQLCSAISQMRKAQGEAIHGHIEKVLQDLEMKRAQFRVLVEEKGQFGENGWDRVEFVFSANEGEPLRPLSKIASGGEMSRIMLALKTILADIDQIDTLIFDEIDTGISGRTAQKVAEKMALIAQKHQVLCITHLPQIAAMADSHYRIEKTVEEGKTTSSIQALTEEQSIEELARMMGGAIITSTTFQNAKEIKELAHQKKMEQ